MNFFYTLIGISLIILGAGILYDPIFHDTKHNFVHDFSEIQRPLGAFLALIGLAFLYVSLRKKSYGSASGYLICSNCRLPLAKMNNTKPLCPTCGAYLEELDGFYERHPELKEE